MGDCRSFVNDVFLIVCDEGSVLPAARHGDRQPDSRKLAQTVSHNPARKHAWDRPGSRRLVCHQSDNTIYPAN